MDGWKHSPLYLSGTGRAFQETAISGSCQLTLAGSTIVSGFGYPGGQSLDGLSFSLCSTLCLCISPHGYFVPLPRRTKVSTLLSSFLLSCLWSLNYILGIPSFWANIHLSVSAYHMCSFVIGLPHSGWYFLVPSICLRNSWTYCFLKLLLHVAGGLKQLSGVTLVKDAESFHDGSAIWYFEETL